jgi:hypothetical protein
MSSIRRHKPVVLKAKERDGFGPANREHREWGYLIMWEFQVLEGMEKRFEKVYGTRGDWAQLFGQDELYMGTELIHKLKGEDLQAGRTYITLDFWTSQQAYEAFRKRHFAKYKAIDQECQEMTKSEREIGRFVRVSNK